VREGCVTIVPKGAVRLGCQPHSLAFYLLNSCRCMQPCSAHLPQLGPKDAHRARMLSDWAASKPTKFEL